MSRRLRLLFAALAIAALLWLLFAAAERFLALAQRFLALPAPLQWTLGLVLAIFAAAGLAVLWWLLRPRRRRRPLPVPDRASLEQRIDKLREHGADTGALATELGELDQRRLGARLYVALFGEISTGKSSLIRALAPQATLASEARGGTTRAVGHYDSTLPDGRSLVLADVPGSRESGGEAREREAREEALRAHAVIYLCAGDLTRSQVDELRWLADFGKPLLLVLNKADQWGEPELAQLLDKLRAQSRGIASAVVAISAGGSERYQRRLADGSTESVERQRKPAIEPLLRALTRLIAPGAEGLEPRREQAVLAGLHQRTGTLEAQTRAETAERIVRQYARRAIVGAMAAVEMAKMSTCRREASRAEARSLSMTASTPCSAPLERTTGMPPPPTATTSTPSFTRSRMTSSSTISMGSGEGTTRRYPRAASSTISQPKARLRCSASARE